MMKKDVVFTVSLVTVALVVFGQSPESLPPKEVLKVVESNGERFLEGRWKGIYYKEILEPRKTDIDARTLLDLIYAKDEIPGFLATPNPYNGLHTNIVILNRWSRIGRTYRSLEKVRIEQTERLLHEIDLQVWVMPNREEALRRVQETMMRAAMPYEHRELPSGLPLGERFWYWEVPNKICFLIGRVVVWVTWYSSVAKADPFMTEALAWGIEYRIQYHSKKLGMAQKPMDVLVSNRPVAQGKTISLSGVTVVPISVLEPAQVTLKTNRTSKEWTVTASRDGHWVKVKAFSWEMETEKGKVRLERPVFPYKGELIVPLRQVAEALGMVVQQKGQTIALMPQ